MNLASIVIIVIFLILIVLGILIIGIYNKLTFYKNRVLNKFEAISKCLKDRTDIIQKIIDIINNNSLHEDSLILELNKLVTKINEENIVNNLLLLINESDDILKKALSLDKIYDVLKSNKEYMSLMDKFKDNQYKIMYAIEIYNEEVEVYNNYKQNKFINIISKIFKFVDYNYYKK